MSNNCKLEKYGCTYSETGCSDCKVNQAYQQGRADGAREFAEWVYGKNFIFGARTKRERINMLLAEWQKVEENGSRG